MKFLNNYAMNESCFNQAHFQSPRRLFVSDFDGTLFRSDGTVAHNDLNALKLLGNLGIVRAIATGRSIYSLERANCRGLPVDYIIFSTGAGVIRYPEGRIIKTVNLKAAEVERVIRVFVELSLDFMIHRPIPDNHLFAYRYSGVANPDFIRRLRLYKEHCWPLDDNIFYGFGRASQLVAIIPPYSSSPEFIDFIRTKLDGLNVIRTTSPLDGESTWIEIFPAHVSKSLTTAWLADQLGIQAENVLTVGNDYNDVDLLEWSGSGFVVGNAPEELKTRFPAVASNDECGVNDAIKRWLRSILKRNSIP